MRIDTLIFSKNNSELLSGIKEINFKEKKLRTYFLCYLAEIEARGLHFEKGYSHLSKFVVEELKHSESEAWKRIQVARNMRKYPALFYAIQENQISMTAASKLCPHFKQGNVETLLSECSGKSVREVEKIIVKHFPKTDVEDSIQNQATPLSVDRVLIQFSADKALAEKLEKAKALPSHEFPEGTLADIFNAALDAIIENNEPKVKRERKPVGEVKRSRYLTRGRRSEVWDRDEGKCAYVSPEGKRCNETKFLEFDHVQPFALNGSSTDTENLRLLCSGHNKYLAIKIFGRSWVKEKIRLRQ